MVTPPPCRPRGRGPGWAQLSRPRRAGGAALVALTHWLPAPIDLTPAEKAAIPPTALALGVVLFVSGACVAVGALVRRPRAVIAGYAMVVMAIPLVERSPARRRRRRPLRRQRWPAPRRPRSAKGARRPAPRPSWASSAYPPLAALLPRTPGRGRDGDGDRAYQQLHRRLPGPLPRRAEFPAAAGRVLARSTRSLPRPPRYSSRPPRIATRAKCSQPRSPLLALDGHYAAYGPCRPSQPSQSPQPPPRRGGGGGSVRHLRCRLARGAAAASSRLHRRHGGRARAPRTDGEQIVGHERARIGARRLAIMDLTTGDQPFVNPDRAVWMVCNGEIYNAPELRRESRRRDIRSAPPVTSRRSYRCTSASGRMAWDGSRECSARGVGRPAAAPRAGARPRGREAAVLVAGGGELRFASEIQALLVFPDQPRRVNPAAAALYAALGYVPAPHTMFAGSRSSSPHTC